MAIRQGQRPAPAVTQVPCAYWRLLRDMKGPALVELMAAAAFLVIGALVIARAINILA